MATSSINQTRENNDHHDDHYDEYDKSEGELAKLALTSAVLIAKGVSIDITAKWWGFTIQLNENAVELLDNCLDYLEEKFDKHFKKETKIRRAISLCVQFKRLRLKNAVERSTETPKCVRMVSPWVIPFALVVVRGASQEEDQNLWSTVWDNDPKVQKWGEDVEFTECMSRNAPALAQHGDLLYCVHRGANENSSLYWTVYSTDKGWSNDTMFPNHKTELNPSLVDFNDTLYCFHRGAGDDHALYYCTFDTGRNSWFDNVKILVGGKYMYSDTGCAVAVFNGYLHLVYKNRDTTDFEHHYFDGRDWNSFTVVPQGHTKDTPALVAYDDKLLLVYVGHNNENLWYDTYDGTKWSGDNQIPNACSKYGPGLAVFDNKVFMAHRGKDGDKNLWYSTYNGKDWTTDTMADHNNGIWTGAPPALASYRDPQCTEDNYEDLVTEDQGTVKTYLPRLICVHRGWG